MPRSLGTVSPIGVMIRNACAGVLDVSQVFRLAVTGRSFPAFRTLVIADSFLGKYSHWNDVGLFCRIRLGCF